MTQEELDSIMNGGGFDDVDVSQNEEVIDDKVNEVMKTNTKEGSSWPPPAPTDDNKMVNQLDDVTRESELKASEIFDIIEKIGNDMMNSESSISDILNIIENNISMLDLLHKKFPSIKKFKLSLKENNKIRDDLKLEIDKLQKNGDQIMNVMDIMQYQDIHRQKIERVINVMRALSKYMNTLFSSEKEDEGRVNSATHIHGDNDTEDVMDNDDIETLLNSFGK